VTGRQNYDFQDHDSIAASRGKNQLDLFMRLNTTDQCCTQTHNPQQFVTLVTVLTLTSQKSQLSLS